MNKEEMKKRGLVFLEDMSLEEEEKMETERRERSKHLENYIIPYHGYAVDGLDRYSAMEEIDEAINKTIEKKRQQVDKEIQK